MVRRVAGFVMVLVAVGGLLVLDRMGPGGLGGGLPVLVIACAGGLGAGGLNLLLFPMGRRRR